MKMGLKTGIAVAWVLCMIIAIGFLMSGYVEAQTTTGIYGSKVTKGYTIYSKTIGATNASAEVVAAVTGKRVKVIGYDLIANGDVNVKFQSNASDDIQGGPLWYFTSNSGVAKPITLINNQPVVIMQTGVGENLYLNLSATQYVSGAVLYYVE
jgi:hypothetical protein